MVECKDPDRVMSPTRRLDNMRNAGQNILHQGSQDQGYAESRGQKRAKEYEKAAIFAKK